VASFLVVAVAAVGRRLGPEAVADRSVAVIADNSFAAVVVVVVTGDRSEAVPVVVVANMDEGTVVVDIVDSVVVVDHRIVG
jgi:hypothetical protein